MSRRGRQHRPDLKAKLGLDTQQGIKPPQSIASQYEVNVSVRRSASVTGLTIQDHLR